MKKISQITSASILIIVAASVSSAVSGGPIRTDGLFDIRVKAIGPSEAVIANAKQRVESKVFSGRSLKAKRRLITFEFLNGNDDQAGSAPTRFRATYYNYTSDLTIIAEGDFAGREPIAVREDASDPGYSPEEFTDAASIIAADGYFGKSQLAKKLELYEAMPPVSNLNGERLVNVGIRDLESGTNEIVGISFKNNSVVRYADNAPPTARATSAGCGVAVDPNGPTGRGLTGQLAITATEQGNPDPVWEMTAIRPSASSGGEGSGIELTDVKYRGKSVLKRAHVPVLNVQYTHDCGPFRDWQYSEGYFQIPTTGVTFPAGVNNSFAVIDPPGVATTVVETGNDVGNFRGVAVYQQSQGGTNELVLVTEMEAGWYRYIMEWRFGFDGRIRPRFGFGSTLNSCVCIQRNHHVYWRFDFDVVSPNNKVFMVEHGRKYLTPITNEGAFLRNYQRNRSFLIQNSNGDEAYMLVPNLTDSKITDNTGAITDTFAKGDFWLLHFQGTAANPSEINDPNSSASINIDPWLTNESLVDQDVVIWYAGHQTRSDDSGFAPNFLTGSHVIGPDLRPVRW